MARTEKLQHIIELCDLEDVLENYPENIDAFLSVKIRIYIEHYLILRNKMDAVYTMDPFDELV